MNFQDLMHSWGIETRVAGEHHHATRGRIQIDCPFCGKGSGGFHLGYHIERGNCSCWRCGTHSLFDLLMALDRCSRKEAWEICQSIDKTGPARKEQRNRPAKLKVPTHGPLLKQHRRYLSRRGFDPDEIEEIWKIKGIGLHSRLKWRLFIPVYFMEELVSWTTRTIGNADPRYRNCPADDELRPLKHCLYGEDLCRHAIVIVEGPTDAWRIGPGAVATFGTQVTAAQIERMLRFPIRAVWFDPDALKKARELVAILESYPGETYLIDDCSSDPDEASESELCQVRKEILDVQ